LTHLRQQDRWFGLRWGDAAQRSARMLMGPRHTAAKAVAMVLVLFLGVSSVWPWDYRVDATLAVRSRDLLFMPAPFDGYLRQVHVDVGDQVAAGATLVELDTRDLLLEASMAEADLVRYTREAEKAMAVRQLAEMQIALARQRQAQAKLELTRHQLVHAQLKAPYEGVVIEGELKKNLGAPVRKGDLLLKLARTTRTYLELEIDQALVHEVQVGTRGEFALVGRPGERYPITLTQLDPAAITKDGRTVYLARAALEGAQQPDWRPGMGGNAKLEAGQRPLIWVLTHRTVRFLREFFWL
jgi:multidrug resistance efflux pump